MPNENGGGMYDDLELICEGECNPGIRDFDTVARNTMEVDRPVPRHSVVAEFVRQLKHTNHISITNEIYQHPIGWCRRWRCSVCGHARLF